MEEEEKNEEEKPEEKQEKTPLITAANEAAERIEKANAEQKLLLERQEELMAQNALGGQSEAGAVPQKEKKLSDEEYSDLVLRGEVNPLKADGYIR
jgi:hypothetical protein